MDQTIAKQQECYIRKDCRLCGSRDLILAVPMRPTPVSDAYVPMSMLDQEQKIYGLDLYLCQSCGLVQIRETVDPESIYRNYLYETTTSHGLVDHYDRYVQCIIDQLKLRQGSFVVEIGSNDGTQLLCFAKKGMKVLGVDPAIEVGRKAAARGIETISDFFNRQLAQRIRNEQGPASLIVANMVLANIDHVGETLKAISDLLADDGFFVLETGYLGSMIEHLVFDNIYHEHLCYFSLKPLISFFEAHGMNIVDVEWVPSKGGSIRCIVQFRSQKGLCPPSRSIKLLLEKEQELKLDSLETYRNFSNALDSNKGELLRLLRDLKKSGKRIAGYGASNSVTTFIYYYEIGEYLDWLIDDNPKKQGSFSPGLHIPVFSSSELYRKKPDVVVILAWRFAEQMIVRNHEYVRLGGQFIIPKPEIRIFTDRDLTHGS